MILSKTASIGSKVGLYYMQPTHKSMQTHISFTFAKFKMKADHFICAATAIITLKNSKPNDPSIESVTQENSLNMAKAWLDLKQPFSLREKVIRNIS
jgi:hypothetical protein